MLQAVRLLTSRLLGYVCGGQGGEVREHFPLFSAPEVHPREHAKPDGDAIALYIRCVGVRDVMRCVRIVSAWLV